jgi:hypothetical protein
MIHSELIQDALADALPVERIPSWLNEPNLDLGNHTPQELLDAGQWEAVVDALWLQDELHGDGPVS